MQPKELIFWIPLLPLLGAAFNLLVGRVLWRACFGRDLPRGLVHFAAILSVVAAFVVSVVVVFVGPDSLLGEFMRWRARGGDGILDGLTQPVYTWITVDTFTVDLAFRVDTLSAVMLMVITFVGSLIHIYSTGYMSHEPRYAAYFGYLNLFTGAMLILVLGDNLPVMFIGWEGVGLCSYLLIGFWFDETANANAGRKAFVVNRVGDFAFLIGMFLLFQAVGSLDFEVLRSDAAMIQYRTGFWGGERVALWAGLFLFIGACGKSAQIPLYVWLPDAMAGPTPVSALIHAATMVTAGVYMVARLSFLYASSTTAMAIVATVGALTALFAAIMAFAQTDFKKVLAYSTVSQLGFMFVGVGVGAYVAGIFHLVTHAFFKAGLFLAAGSVMHAMSGSGDIMKMGGLRKKMPRTHLAFVSYWLAICGIVPFAGFFSKDEILAGAFAANGAGWVTWYGEFLWVILTIAALGTAFYMSRLYFLVFAGESRADAETQAHIHESPGSMTGPLLILGAFTVVIGFLGLPHIQALHLPNIIGEWLHASLARPELAPVYPAIQESLYLADHHGDGMIAGLMVAALAFGLIGIFVARAFYRRGLSKWVEDFTAAGVGKALYKLSYHKFYVDEIYDVIIVRPFRWLATALFEFVDRFVIDLIFVNGAAFVIDVCGRIGRWLQNGQVHRYMVGVVIGAAVIFGATTWGWAPDFSYRTDGRTVQFTAEVGAGPANLRGRTIRWDLDGDGAPDLMPGIDRASAGDADYLDDVSVEIDLQEVGGQVTLWYTDPVFGTTRTVVKPIAMNDLGNGGER
ncbi:NADH-quinone oxidoreductase subunit L [Haliangium sp.]|uniref:NADH-quinone oxidoreductase subunit L n=1 Tax=Haliangium sp. TaxID=2663208 RepID=UPI003D103E5C